MPNVCDWLEVVGLGQYRKKFLHHCVNGYLLLQLRDELLKTELGIGPLVRGRDRTSRCCAHISVSCVHIIVLWWQQARVSPGCVLPATPHTRCCDRRATGCCCWRRCRRCRLRTWQVLQLQLLLVWRPMTLQRSCLVLPFQRQQLARCWRQA